MDVEISGVNVDVELRGVRGRVEVETVQGDVTVRGGRRDIALRTVSGDVVLSDAVGRIAVESTNGDIDLVGVTGEITAATLNGDVMFRNIQSDAVEATTVNGDIDYSGTISEDGRYTLDTHNGDISVAVPDGTNATVSVSTFSGEFESDFPVTLAETPVGGKRLSLALGNGSARVELESFGGTIRLYRPRGRNR
jgi:DUF4097 and DUF4098 domain-containing protein YvlB